MLIPRIVEKLAHVHVCDLHIMIEVGLLLWHVPYILSNQEINYYL